MSAIENLPSFENSHNKISEFCEKFWYDQCIELGHAVKQLQFEVDSLRQENQQLQWQLNTQKVLTDFWL
jgi:hypothetical protein